MTDTRKSRDGFSVTYDEFEGAKVSLPTFCEPCGLNVEGVYDMHMIFHHPETRPPIFGGAMKEEKKTKKRKKK